MAECQKHKTYHGILKGGAIGILQDQNWHISNDIHLGNWYNRDTGYSTMMVWRRYIPRSEIWLLWVRVSILKCHRSRYHHILPWHPPPHASLDTTDFFLFTSTCRRVQRHEEGRHLSCKFLRLGNWALRLGRGRFTMVLHDLSVEQLTIRYQWYNDWHIELESCSHLAGSALVFDGHKYCFGSSKLFQITAWLLISKIVKFVR